MPHAVESATLADVLERILDKGLVIAGDIKIKLVDIELLTIQIRLLVCSVDKAREMGIDWWTTNSYLNSAAKQQEDAQELEVLRKRIAQLEETSARIEPVR
ncbi:MAG: gas vesicle protein [Nitrospirae bacterium]|nr:gas vesicle protein [Nitrospirota bacterium]